MADLEERLRSQLGTAAAGVEAPDTAPPGLVRRVQRARQRRLAAVGVAAAVLAAAIGLTAANLSSNAGSGVRRQVTAGRGATGFPAAPDLTVTLERLPESPLGQRVGASGVWTGTEFIVWGGDGGNQVSAQNYGDGAAYNPATGEWRVLADSPLSPRAGHTAVWTGTEMIVWGGASSATGFRGVTPPLDGAAYNPSTDTWRSIAAAPSERANGEAVMVGNRMVVGAGGTLRGSAEPVLLVYDVHSDAWSSIVTSIEPGVYDIAPTRTGVAVATVDRSGSKKHAVFLHVDLGTGVVHQGPESNVEGQALRVAVTATADGAQVVTVAQMLGDGPTEVGLWTPPDQKWSELTELPEGRLLAGAGDFTFEPADTAWFDGWIGTVSPLGASVASPASKETAVPDDLEQSFDRLCGGYAAVAFSEDSMFVWGGQQCAGNAPDAGGPTSEGVQIRLRPSL